MLGVLLKFLIPVIAFYFLQKLIRQSLAQIQNPGGSTPSGKNDEVIDICPECGQVNQKGHSCNQL